MSKPPQIPQLRTTSNQRQKLGRNEAVKQLEMNWK